MSTNNIKLHAKLLKLGFSPEEADLYLTGITSGPSSIQELARAINMKRTTVYLYMKGMIDKGIFEIIFEKGKKYYAATQPEGLKDIIRKEKEVLENKEKLLNELLPEIKPLFTKPASLPNLQYFEGESGLWSVIDKIIKSRETVYAIGSSQQLFATIDRKDFDERFTQRRIKMGVKAFSITDHYYPALKKYYANKQYGEYRFIAEKIDNPSFLAIFGDKVALANLQSQMYAIYITNQALADNLRYIFQFIWSALEGKNLPDVEKFT